MPNGVSNFNQLVGDYTNPILKPEAAQIVKQHGDLSMAGVTYPTPSKVLATFGRGLGSMQKRSWPSLGM